MCVSRIRIVATVLAAAGLERALGQAVTLLAGATAGGSADGTGAAGLFSGPIGVAYGGNNLLYITDSNNNRIRQLDVSTKVVTTLAGTIPTGSADGTGTGASFNGPKGIAYAQGALFIADYFNCMIRQVVVSTQVVTTVAGNNVNPYCDASAAGTAAGASFKNPLGVATNGAGTLFVTTYDGMLMRLVVSTRVVTVLAGTTNAFAAADGTGTAATFLGPQGIAYDQGTLWIADYCMIRKFVVSTLFVSTVAGSPYNCVSAAGTGSGASFYNLVGITTGGTNGADTLFVTTGDSKLMQYVVSTGVAAVLAGSAGNLPSFLDSDGQGKLFVADTNDNEILQITYTLAANCIGRGAPVLLANGSSTLIEKLASGDLVATSKGPTRVLALHGLRLTAAQVVGQVLHFSSGALGAGLPDSPLTVTSEHGFHNFVTGSWSSFGEVKSLASEWPAGLYDDKNGMMVYNVALDTDDERSVIVAGMQLGSWTRGHPDRARMPVEA